MKKILQILILITLFINFNTAVNANNYVIGTIENTYKQLKKATPFETLFLLDELGNAMQVAGNIASKCYRVLVTKSKKYYNIDKSCLEFRIVLGFSAKDWEKNMKRLQHIFELNTKREKNGFYNDDRIYKIYLDHSDVHALNMAKIVQVLKATR